MHIFWPHVNTLAVPASPKSLILYTVSQIHPSLSLLLLECLFFLTTHCLFLSPHIHKHGQKAYTDTHTHWPLSGGPLETWPSFIAALQPPLPPHFTISLSASFLSFCPPSSICLYAFPLHVCLPLVSLIWSALNFDLFTAFYLSKTIHPIPFNMTLRKLHQVPIWWVGCENVLIDLHLHCRF